MFSSLSKGYGHWDSGQVDLFQKDYKEPSAVLPSLEGEGHRHGVTVSGRSTAMSQFPARPKSREMSEGQMSLPKTYSTRKGALQLFTAPDDLDREEEDKSKTYTQGQRPHYYQLQRMAGKELIDLSLRLGTLERLTKSVLQYGDQDYDKDKSSISDEKNKLFLKFLHSLNEDADSSSRPGGDLSVYLRDLKTRASSRYYSEGSMYFPKSRESQELQAILRGLDSNWPLSFPQDSFSDRRSTMSEQFTRPVSRVSSHGGSPVPPSTPRSTYQVLSTKKLAASIKSSSYLGRPSSTASVRDDEPVLDFDQFVASPQPVTRASVTKRKWSPTDSTDDRPDSRVYRSSLASGSIAEGDFDSDDDRKRTRHRDYSSGLLFQGRNKYKGKGQSAVQVKGKGEGHVTGDRVSSNVNHSKAVESSIYEVASIDEETEEDVPDAWKRHSQQELQAVEEEKMDIRTSPTGSERGSGITRVSSTSTRTPPSMSIVNIQDSNAAVINKQEQQHHTKSSQGSDRREEDVSDSGLVTSDVSENLEIAIVAAEAPVDVVDTADVEVPFDDNTEEGSTVLHVTVETATTEFATVEQDEEVEDVKYEEEEEDVEEEATEQPVMEDYIEVPADTETLTETEEPVQDEYQDEVEIVRAAQTPVEDLMKEEEGEAQETMETVALETKEPPVEDGFSSDNDSVKGDIVEEDVEIEEDLLKGEFDVNDLPKGELDVPDTEVVADVLGVVETDLQDKEEEIQTVYVESEKDKDVSVFQEEEESTLVTETVQDKVDEDYEGDIDNRSSKHRGKTGSRVSEDDSDYEVKGFLLASVERIQGEENAFSEIQSGFSAASDTPVSLSRPSSGHVLDDPLALINSAVEFDAEKLADDSPVEAEGKGSRPGSNESQKTSKASRPSSAVSQNIKPFVDSDVAPDLTVLSTPDVNADKPGKTEKENVPGETPSSQTVPEPVIENHKEVREVQIKDLPAESPAPSKPQTVSQTTKPAVRQPVLKKKQPTAIVRRAGSKSVIGNPNNKTAMVKNKPEPPVNKKPEITVTASHDAEAETVNKVPLQKLENIEHVAKNASSSVPENLTKKPDEKIPETEIPVIKAAILQEVETTLPVTDTDGGDPLADLASRNLLVKTKGKGKKKGADKKSKASSVKSVTKSDDGKTESSEYRIVLESEKLENREKFVIPDHLTEALGRRPSLSYEALERDLERRGFLKDGKVTEIVDSTLSGPTLQAVGEGLTDEEFELAKKILQTRLAEAQERLDDPGKKKKGGKTVGKGGKGKKGKKKEVEEGGDVETERAVIREKHEAEKEKRDLEAKELQRKIAERRALLKNQENLANEKSREIREEMERLEREAEAMQQAEEDARQQLAEVRKKQREERELRRKADLERKKQQALERREQEKKQQEEAKKKELEMLEKIADAEMRRRLREEEERKRYEEDRLAQEQYEEEMRLAQLEAEEEEERRRELERQSEEEALERFRQQQEAAEREARKLREEQEKLEEDERKRREYMLAEQRKLEEERSRQKAQEQARKEQERLHLLELRRMEEEARQQMQEQLERRRAEALLRRDVNVENRTHSDKLRHNQGITRAWTFSYFIKWPRDSYERPIGGGLDKRKRLRPRPAPPKPVENPPDGGEQKPEATQP